jgi:hypothetical protein
VLQRLTASFTFGYGAVIWMHISSVVQKAESQKLSVRTDCGEMMGMKMRR